MPAATVAGMLTVGLLTVGCSTQTLDGGHTTTPAATHAHAGAATITIGKKGDTFSPAPAGAKTSLTAQQAWARFQRNSGSPGHTAIPVGTTVRLGSLTMVIGPIGPHGKMAYGARNELAWGYSWHQCPQSQGPSGSTVPPNPCIAWTFLNARNGQLIVITWQIYT
jgi:hypothetical protein